MRSIGHGPSALRPNLRRSANARQVREGVPAQRPAPSPTLAAPRLDLEATDDTLTPSNSRESVKRLALVTLAFFAVACADRSATQYVGTVMREAAPEKEGSMRLTFFSHTDTSFAGVIELGAPARGTGSVYASYEGPELHIFTVAAQSGDTILWISPLSDVELGGRFHVLGGDRAGEQGTWRAHLVKGPPATRSTLRLPAGAAQAPLRALWPLLVLIAIGISLGRWIRRTPAPAAPADGAAWRAFPSRLSGVGGWLLLFTIGQSVGILVWLARARSSLDEYAGGIGIAAAVPGLEPLIVLEAAMFLLGLAIAVVGLFLIMRRSAYAPRFWFASLASICAYQVLDLVAMQSINPRLVQLVGAKALAGTGSTEIASEVRLLIVGLIWLAYWSKSQRVRETFGAAALDRAVITPETASVIAPEPPPIPLPVRDPRSRRLKLRVAGGVLALLLALVIVSVWSTRVSPYIVADGTDIRTAVAGRWAWVSDTAGCRQAHTIAFDQKNKVMTIASGDTSDSSKLTTYDILSSTRSSIRGAIRGETRLTSAGKPVVWDLVLTGPDEYRWKRADWASNSRSYTGPIRRCPAIDSSVATSR